MADRNKADVLDFISVYENGGQSDYRRLPMEFPLFLHGIGII